MAKIRINTTATVDGAEQTRTLELRVVDLNTARNRDIMALQEQSGLRLQRIAELGKSNDIFALMVVSFLSRHNAGLFVKWDDLLDGSPEDLGEFIKEPGDIAREAEANGEDDPTQAVTASETPAADAAAELADQHSTSGPSV